MGGMIADAIVRSIPRERRLFTFALSAVACLPAAIIFGVQIALAGNVGTALAWTALFCGSFLGSLTHACMALSASSERRHFLVIADLLIVVGMILSAIGVAGLVG
jgi:hypothetical protein